MAKFNVCSYNVRGLGDSKKRACIFIFLKQSHYDIIYLQETHSKPDTEIKWKKEWGGSCKFAHGTGSSRGVAILIRKKFYHTIHEEIIDSDGRYLIVTISINENNYTLFNHYAPTKDRPTDQLKHLLTIENLMAQFVNDNTLLAGDFNTYLDPDLDKSGGKREKRSEFAARLLDFMEETEMVDIWRIRNPDSLRYTRRQKSKAGIVHSRLDFFLVPVHLEYDILNTEIKPSIFSDHSIVVITIQPNEAAKRGK
jgi:exonuclease III